MIHLNAGISNWKIAFSRVLVKKRETGKESANLSMTSFREEYQGSYIVLFFTRNSPISLLRVSSNSLCVTLVEVLVLERVCKDISNGHSNGHRSGFPQCGGRWTMVYEGGVELVYIHHTWGWYCQYLVWFSPAKASRRYGVPGWKTVEGWDLCILETAVDYHLNDKRSTASAGHSLRVSPFSAMRFVKRIHEIVYQPGSPDYLTADCGFLKPTTEFPIINNIHIYRSNFNHPFHVLEFSHLIQYLLDIFINWSIIRLVFFFFFFLIRDNPSNDRWLSKEIL